MKYAFIKQHREEHKISRMCEVLKASPSGFYEWLDRPESIRAKENRRLTCKIVSFHRRSRGIYGSPKVHRDLMADGESCGVNRVARLMRQAGVQSKMARKFVITTDSKNTQAPAPDLIKRRFTVARKNLCWVSDTTFVATRQGWLYLAVILDLYSRQVIGWSMADKNNSQLVGDALMMAILRRGYKEGVIVHSDQGSTYASGQYQKLLLEHDLTCSMARKGECLDNAVAESFFGTLKNELVYHEDFKTRGEARLAIFEYIEVFYNRQRRHASLGYLTPLEFEARVVSI